MKLTRAAFELLYAKCDPQSRYAFFQKLRKTESAEDLVIIFVHVPMSEVERFLSENQDGVYMLYKTGEGEWEASRIDSRCRYGRGTQEAAQG